MTYVMLTSSRILILPLVERDPVSSQPSVQEALEQLLYRLLLLEDHSNSASSVMLFGLASTAIPVKPSFWLEN